MAYLNFSSALKGTRSDAIVSALGSTYYLLVYSGTQPSDPDFTCPSGNLLGTLTNSGVAVKSWTVVSATIVAGGSGGTNGTQTVTGTTGTGTKFTASVTVAGGTITAILSITLGGTYSVLPTNVNIEPVTGASLTSATLAIVMTSVVTMAFTTNNASASGTAGFARVATATTAGGVGIIDEDIATSGASFTINTTSISLNGPIVVTSATITEA
jgi:hypothetical protein